MMIFNINFHNSNSNAQVCVHIILKLEQTNVTTQYSKLHSIFFPSEFLIGVCTSNFTYNCDIVTIALPFSLVISDARQRLVSRSRL